MSDNEREETVLLDPFYKDHFLKLVELTEQHVISMEQIVEAAEWATKRADEGQWVAPDDRQMVVGAWKVLLMKSRAGDRHADTLARMLRTWERQEWKHIYDDTTTGKTYSRRYCPQCDRKTDDTCGCREAVHCANCNQDYPEDSA